MTRSLFGRTPEIALIEAAFVQLGDGRGSAHHIVGEPGIGKTALLAAAQRRSDVLQFVSRSAAADNSDQRRRLALVVDLLPGISATPFGDPISAALASIDKIAKSGPLTLLADDLHWADAASLDVLAAIARRAEEIGVLLVTAARPSPQSIDLGRFEAAIDRSGRRIALDALGSADIADLVEDTMGARPARSLTRLLADASGNPFLTVELLRALDHDGTIHVEGGSVRLLAGSSIPPRLRDRLVREAILAAGNDSLLIRAAAVIPGGFTAEELATMLNRPLVDVVSDLLNLSDAKVLEEHQSRVAFRHDIIRQAIIDATPTPVVRALNRRAVTVLTAANADHARIASCMLVAADPTNTDDLASLIDLGMALRDENAFAAIDLLSMALGSLGVGDLRHDEVALALGTSLLDLGRFSDVFTLLDEHFGDRSRVRLDVGVLRGLALSLSGKNRGAVQPIEPDFDIAGSFVSVDARAVTAVAELSTLEFLSGHVQCAEQLVHWLETSGVEMDPESVAYLCDTQALLHAQHGSFEAALSAAERGMMTAVESPSAATWRARPTLTTAMMLDAVGRGAEALRMLRQAQNEPCPRWNVPLLQFGAAISLYRSGEWDDALAEVAAGLAATDELGMRLATSWPFALTIAIHSARGDPGSARAWLQRARQEVDTHAIGIEWMMYAAAMVEEAAGAPGVAIDILRTVVDAAIAFGAPAILMNLSPDTARLAVASGDTATLHTVVDNMVGLASNTGSPVVHAFADWVGGWRFEDFMRVERAASSMAGCGRHAEAARARHDAAVLAALTHHTDDARRLATAAFVGYEQLRAEQLHARLRSEMRAAGIAMRRRRAVARPTSGWHALTRTERQVVDMVADGLMNGEIADQLYVSRRTVESHLTRVYPKLGFSRRAELVIGARRQRDHDAGASPAFG